MSRLTLTRKTNETIIIGDDEIRITVLGVKGNQVKLGVSAPKSLSVHRQEIFLKIREEKQDACFLKTNLVHDQYSGQTLN